MSPTGWKVSNMLLRKSRGNCQQHWRNAEAEPRRKRRSVWMCPVVKVKPDTEKNNIAQELGMLGSWIKLSWTWSSRRSQDWILTSWEPENYSGRIMGMGELNSDDHYISYCGQESLRRNGVFLIFNKRVWNAVLGCNLKHNVMISYHFQGKPVNTTLIQVYAPTT